MGPLEETLGGLWHFEKVKNVVFGVVDGDGHKSASMGCLGDVQTSPLSQGGQGFVTLLMGWEWRRGRCLKRARARSLG